MWGKGEKGEWDEKRFSLRARKKGEREGKEATPDLFGRVEMN